MHPIDSFAARSLKSDTTMAVAVLAIAFLLNFLARGVIDTLLVFMLQFEREFGWKRSSLTGVYSAYLVVFGLMSPVSGLLLGRLGPRLTYALGMVILVVAMSCAASFSALWQVYVVIGGLGGVAASLLGMVPAAALIGRWFDRRMSIAMAIAYAGFGSGVLVIVPLAQLGIDTYGWRQTYHLIAIALACTMPLFLLPWSRLAGGSAHYRAARRDEGSSGTDMPNGTWSIATAIRTREFWLLAQVFFFTACAVYSVIVQVVPFLVETGYQPIEAALAFGSSGMLSVAGVLFAGALSARFGNRFTATLSFVGTLIGTAALLAFSVMSTPVLVFIWVISFGLTQGARGPIISTLTARIFARGSVASIFGAIIMLMAFGSALGSWMSGFLHDLTGSYRAAFVFSGLCTAAACAPFWLSDRLHRPMELVPPGRVKENRGADA
jgi:MFS family permease